MVQHLYELIVQRAAAYPDAVALGGQQGLRWRTLTSRELVRLVDVLAEELAGRGVQAGDRVVLWLPNGWRTPVYLLALWKLGAIVVPFDRETNAEAAAAIIDAVTPRLILAGFGERPAWAAGGALTEWWEPGTGAGSRGEGSIGDRRLATDNSSLTPDPRPPALDVAAIFYTSGTTGQPKGCVITHANLLSQVEALRDNIPLGPDCRLASILPLSHLFELTCGLLYPLSQGAAIHYIPSRRGPDIVRVLQEQRITHMIAVPQLLTLMINTLEERLRRRLPEPVYNGLLALAERLPLGVRRVLFFMVHRQLGGQLRMLASGGAALPPETHVRWERLGVRVVQGYGTSECSPVVAAGLPDGSTPIGSVGRPIRGVEVRLGEDGELLVRGPNVMRGYWQDPARTALVLRDGWYHTGDLAEIDAAGNIRIAGRARDLIVLPSGLNVWPEDIEDVLRAQPGVKDAVVLPVPTPAGGLTLHAYLIPIDPAATGEIERVVAAANGRLAVHQRVNSASWWPEADFPRTTTLKVRRALLPQPEQLAAAAVTIDVTAAGDDPAGAAIAAVARTHHLAPSQTLGQLGFDSLSLVELATALEEKTGRSIADDALSLDMTVEQVRAAVAQAPVMGEGEALAVGAQPARDEGGIPPRWPFTWGRFLRALGLPFELLYRFGVTRTVVLGGEHLRDLPTRIVLAGTHHSFADLPTLQHGLRQTPARHLAGRLIIAAAAVMMRAAGPLGSFATLAFGLYPLRQYTDREASLRRLAELAALGNPVVIFPQGHHANPAAERAGDASADFKQGVAHLATALEAVVVPFGLAGTEQRVLPTAEGFRGLVIGGIPVQIKRGPVAVSFGPPLTPEPGESAQVFTDRLQATCFALTRDAEAALAALEDEASPVSSAR